MSPLRTLPCGLITGILSLVPGGITLSSGMEQILGDAVIGPVSTIRPGLRRSVPQYAFPGDALPEEESLLDALE